MVAVRLTKSPLLRIYALAGVGLLLAASFYVFAENRWDLVSGLFEIEILYAAVGLALIAYRPTNARVGIIVFPIVILFIGMVLRQLATSSFLVMLAWIDMAALLGAFAMFLRKHWSEIF
jgi:uncharacterized membrane protein SirB2